MATKDKSSTPLNITQILNLFGAAAAPLAILSFIVMVIIYLDLYGQYQATLQDIEKYGRPAEGTISGISEAYVFVDIANDQGTVDVYYARSKYYPPEALSELKIGDRIETRAVPSEEWAHVADGGELILTPYASSMMNYTGYISEGPWPALLISLLIVVMRPEVLYVGFESVWQNNTGEEQPS